MRLPKTPSIATAAAAALLLLALLLLALLAPAVAPAASAARGVPRPSIIAKPIPFPAKRKREMAAYARRHYGIDSHRLRGPRVMVEHYTVNHSVQATFDTFAPQRSRRRAARVAGRLRALRRGQGWPDLPVRAREHHVPPYRRPEPHGDRDRARRALRS